MFGMIHRSLEALIIAQYGSQTWDIIKYKADIDTDVFSLFENYPDEYMHKLYQAATQVLSISSNDLSFMFGKHWYHYSVSEGFKELLQSTGDDLWTFIANLNELHQQIENVFAGMKPPIFSCSDVKDKSLVLHYSSSREGFAYVVIGAIEEIAKQFNTPVSIKRLDYRENGAEHDTFLITKLDVL
ncbi:heme NO-binding domain-containing protein [Gammaproteobacteria bacterium AS21]